MLAAGAMLTYAIFTLLAHPCDSMRDELLAKSTLEVGDSRATEAIDAHSAIAFLEDAVVEAPRRSVTVLNEDSCQNGTLNLEGKVLVDKKLTLEGCRRLHGEVGTEVTLKGPLEFEGGDLSTSGDLHFEAVEVFQQPCVRIGGNLSTEGHLSFTNCHSTEVTEVFSLESGGGALFVKGTLRQEEGVIAFHDCSSTSSGGGVYVLGELQQSGASAMHCNNCSSQERGGGVYVHKHLKQSGASAMHCNGCSSKENGGGVHVFRHLRQSDHSTMQCNNCSSEECGGGVFVFSGLKQSGASAMHCVYVVKDLKQTGGSTMQCNNCSSKKHGGGVYVFRDLQQINGSAMRCNNCCSKGNGGGVYVDEGLQQINGSAMRCNGCSSKEYGGGLYVSHSVQQDDSTIELDGCSSGKSGGGLFVGVDYNYTAGKAIFRSCTAAADGGGLYAHRFMSQARSALAFFENCTAARGGGAHFGSTNVAGKMEFRKCRAEEAGGGVRIDGLEGSSFGHLLLKQCSAPQASGLQGRNVSIDHLELVNTVDKGIDAASLTISKMSIEVETKAIKPDISIEAVHLLVESDIDCRQLRQCELIIPASAQLDVGNLTCGLGAGIPMPPRHGCIECPENSTQVENSTHEQCKPCPTGASFCYAAKLQMEPGMMLQGADLEPLHCPNKAACPGGDLPFTENGRRMCEKGYGGPGCVECREEEGVSYLMADSSVLACAPCAHGTSQHLLQWGAFLAQRTFLFGITAASILRAGNEDAKGSDVFINQLMAFTAVSKTIVAAVMNTDTAQSVKTDVVRSLYALASGLSEFGSGQGAGSTHCLMSYVGLEATELYGVHLLDLAIATVLVLILSLKSFPVALVAGLNCFLPTILADFAKYAVCYRLKEDALGGKLICKHLPFEKEKGFATVLISFMLVFATALLVWLRLSRSSSDEETVPCYKAFLTKKYVKVCRYFEAERLVRKVLLATAAAALPTATYPDVQMTVLTVITGTSLLLYGIYQPYHEPEWNWSELALLVTALMLISIASTVISNEIHWDKTEFGQKTMIVGLGATVSIVCCGIMMKIGLEVWRERRSKAAPD
ncbi:Probable outer membrane protein PmpB (Polymorphic membrane protein B) [Durusdinium trenchii]|uniref:Probable outer membrane protein PmpB (Polymorphic membrane protein B) n=1 Tax=Durusdinium trenchii TaxID=1381693 RepID=A0ABP0N074_9DINO